MLLIGCLINLIFYAIIALFVLWIVSYIIGMFIPGVPTLVPLSAEPSAGRIVTLVYLLVGLILLLNFLLCAFGGGGERSLLPPLWMPH